MNETHRLADYPLSYEKTGVQKIHRKGLKISPEEKQRRKLIIARRKAEKLRAKRKTRR